MIPLDMNHAARGRRAHAVIHSGSDLKRFLPLLLEGGRSFVRRLAGRKNSCSDARLSQHPILEPVWAPAAPSGHRRLSSWAVRPLVVFGLMAGCLPTLAATIWTGPMTSFTKANSADWTQAANQDRLTPNVWLTRASTEGLFNIKSEASYDRPGNTSPADTEWATGTTANLGSLSFTSWYNWSKHTNGGPANTVGVDAVLHLISEDIYIDIKFTSWSSISGGGFSYQRSTPAAGNVAPSVAITNPVNNASFIEPATVTIEADASDSDGSVAGVEFFDGGVSLGSDSSAPYGITVNLALGTHTLTAVATDNLGATNVSSAITVTVATNTPPSVAITSPANGASFVSPASVTIDASASDTDGTVTNVQFFDGATLLGSDATSPFSLALTLYPGTHPLTAVAWDDRGASSVSLVTTVLVTTVTIPNPIADRIPKGDLAIELQTVADGLASPLGMAVPDDGSNRMFVYDQSGAIWVVIGTSRLPVPLLDVRARLNPSAKWDYDERGLLGVATHPNFALNPFIYTYTSETNAGAADFPATGTNRNHQSVITEWRIDPANTNRVDPTSRREVVRIDQPQSNHNGGTMRFGPDGLLYITLGDGGQSNDVGDGHVPGGNAQNTMQIWGKVVRIDVDGNNSANGKYGIPTGNPFDGTTGLREIFAYGVRNPFAFSFDRTTGDLYLADVGQGKVEEINIVTNGGNYGWNVKEGTFWFDGAGNIVTAPVRPVPPGLVDPIAQYDHDDGVAIIGGYVYRGTAIPALQGKYVFADWGSFGAPSGRLFYLDSGNVIKEFKLGLEDRRLGYWVKGIGEGPNGDLYVFASRVVGPAGNTGKMFKIVPGPSPITFSSITTSNGTTATNVWSGGVGPFALQRKNSLLDSTWVNTGFTTQTSATSTADSQAGFFRVQDTGRQPPIPLSVYLSGGNERPTPLVNSATGFGLLSLDGNTLKFALHYSGLSGNATAAHIHGAAPASANAGVMIDLAPYNGGAYGSNGVLSGIIILTDAQKANILAGRTYVNFHTSANPGGEMRGQIVPVLMQVALNGANQRPTPVAKPGVGLGLLTLVSNQLSFHITYRGLSGPATAAHIHGPALPSANAGVLIDLAPFNGGAFGSSGTIAGAVTLTDSQLAAVVDGLTYINFHTAAHGGGEIRGQIVPQATAVPLTAPLTGLSERPTPITNSATGAGFFSLEGNTLTFSVNYGSLTGPATAAHIHGPTNTAQNAGVLIDLAPFNGGAFGTSGTFSGTRILTAAQRDMFLNGQTYLNVHTAANPGGEIRGQIAPVLMQVYASGASERPNPVFSNGSALGNLALVLNRLSLCVAYGGLTTSANNMHIHGPAAINASAGVLVDMVPLHSGAFGVSGRIVGGVTLTPAQRGNVVDGQTYLNIHSTTFGAGEIRGQILR